MKHGLCVNAREDLKSFLNGKNFGFKEDGDEWKEYDVVLAGEYLYLYRDDMELMPCFYMSVLGITNMPRE